MLVVVCGRSLTPKDLERTTDKCILDNTTLQLLWACMLVTESKIQILTANRSVIQSMFFNFPQLHSPQVWNGALCQYLFQRIITSIAERMYVKHLPQCFSHIRCLVNTFGVNGSYFKLWMQTSDTNTHKSSLVLYILILRVLWFHFETLHLRRKLRYIWEKKSEMD